MDIWKLRVIENALNLRFSIVSGLYQDNLEQRQDPRQANTRGNPLAIQYGVSVRLVLALGDDLRIDY